MKFSSVTFRFFLNICAIRLRLTSSGALRFHRRRRKWKIIKLILINALWVIFKIFESIIDVSHSHTFCFAKKNYKEVCCPAMLILRKKTYRVIVYFNSADSDFIFWSGFGFEMKVMSFYDTWRFISFET